MHALRTSSTLARLVLAWFVLTLGVAVASPLVHPQTMELVCVGDGGMKVVIVDADGGAVEIRQHTLDCPMCLATTLPAPPAFARVGQSLPLGHALTPVAAAHIAALLGPPLPPRGPPAL